MIFKTACDPQQSMGDRPRLKCPVWSSVTNKGEGKMYGILLESVQFYVVRDVGEDTWRRILEHAGINNMIFTTHDTYKDEVMTSLAKSCAHVTKTKDTNEWMTFFGTCFVDFCSGYGYDKLLRVAGRYYRDFLHGIDNIHEIIRFSYPRLQSPSFLVLSEDKEGCVLLYQSKRHGFKYYVKGQLQQCAKKFYDVTVNITVIEEVFVEGRTHVKFRLDFDNSVYVPETVPDNISGKQEFSSLTGDRFLQVFPFCIVFNSQLIIKNVGQSMAAFLKGDHLVGCSLREKFLICRPLIPCVWSKILRFQGVIFELEYIHGDELADLDTCHASSDLTRIMPRKIPPNDSEKSFEERILLRGEMKYIKEWDRVAFLCTPLINNLNHLQKTGLFINDLNMFDMSRDMVMAGWQYASQLERSILKQRGESEIISKNMKEIEAWKKKSNSLLYAMIPQVIADRLKAGEKPINTCEVFDNVTIMFNYMVGFSDICANATPMEIVTCINDVFILFDQIVDKYNVFKVETLGDAVYMVAGGVPDRSPDHAINVAGLALELKEKAKSLLDPMSTSLDTRIGMHTGSVVGGVVGRRMPQYCLFGDTVNTASRMQTYSMPGRIHLSEPCYECLKESDFVTVERGTVNIKGKGEMKTYWLAGKAGEAKTQEFLQAIKQEKSQAVLKPSSYDSALDLHGMHASTSTAQFALTFELESSNPPNLGKKKKSAPRFSSHHDLLTHTYQFSPATNFYSLPQTPEEQESEIFFDNLRNTTDIPVISISEPILDIPIPSPDATSFESVSFFLHTDEIHPKYEVESDSGVSVSDVRADIPIETITQSDTSIANTNLIHPSEETALLDNEEPFHNSDNLIDHEEPDVIEEDSCLNFSRCPLFSNIFSGPALRCSPCGYYSDNNDDEKICQIIAPQSLDPITVSVLGQNDATSVHNVIDHENCGETECTKSKPDNPFTSGNDIIVVKDIKSHGSEQDSIHHQKQANLERLEHSKHFKNMNENENNQCSSHSLLSNADQLPEWLKTASNDKTCLCQQNTNQTDSTTSGLKINNGACKREVPFHDTSSNTKTCKCPKDGDSTQAKSSSSPVRFCLCTTNKCGLLSACSYCDTILKGDIDQCPSTDTRFCKSSDLDLNSPCNKLTVHNKSIMSGPLITCQNGTCLSNGNTSLARLSEGTLLRPGNQCIDIPQLAHHTSSKQCSRRNSSASEVKGNVHDYAQIILNGNATHVDTVQNGTVKEISESQITCLRSKEQRNHDTYSKSFSEPLKFFQIHSKHEKKHRCYSDPGTRGLCKRHQPGNYS